MLWDSGIGDLDEFHEPRVVIVDDEGGDQIVDGAIALPRTRLPQSCLDVDPALTETDEFDAHPWLDLHKHEAIETMR